MRRTNVLSYVRLAGPLLLCSVLVVGTGNAGVLQGTSQKQGQVKVECGGAAKDCLWPVKSLGEKAGCACFACEYRSKKQRVICTANVQDKKTLRKLELEKKPPRATVN